MMTALRVTPPAGHHAASSSGGGHMVTCHMVYTGTGERRKERKERELRNEI